MSFSDHQPTDKLDNQVVLFKSMMEMITSAGRMRFSPEMSENFYAQVRTLIAFQRPNLSDEGVAELNAVIEDAQEKWMKRGSTAEAQDPLAVSKALADKGDATFYCALHLLEVLMVLLNKKGILRLTKKSGITGFGHEDPETGKITVSLMENPAAGILEADDDEGEAWSP